MKASEPKWNNSILNITGVNSLRLRGLQIMKYVLINHLDLFKFKLVFLLELDNSEGSWIIIFLTHWIELNSLQLHFFDRSFEIKHQKKCNKQTCTFKLNLLHYLQILYFSSISFKNTKGKPCQVIFGDLRERVD